MATPAYFLSDVHLSLTYSDEEKRRRKRLFRLFDVIESERGTLYLVGDFFDFWFEYKHTSQHIYFDVLARLQQLVDSGVEVHYVLGNHDYWTRDFLTDVIGITVHRQPITIDAGGRRLLLAHGDGTLADEGGYRLMRRVIRSKLFVFLYRWLHPDLGIAFASAFSHNNRKTHKKDSAYLDAKFAALTKHAEQEWAKGIDGVVFGHYHLNQIHTVENTDKSDPNLGKQFLCLGDWISHFTYGKIVDEGLTLEQWPE